MARNIKYVIKDDKVYYWFNWCKSYYTSEFCKKKLKELKKEYVDARRGSSIKDYDCNGNYVRFYKLQVLLPVEI